MDERVDKQNGKEGVEANGKSGKPGELNSFNVTSRRQFIKTIGSLVFGLTLVDKTCRNVFGCDECDACGEGCPDCGEVMRDCYTNGPGGGPGEVDANCCNDSIKTNADQGCGDCNDKHDDDNHCGQQLSGGQLDPDAMCGHAPADRSVDEDNNCKNTGDTDYGCGTHTGPWGTAEDPDNGCPDPPNNSSDKNCTSRESDAYCQPGLNTSTPDEHCHQAPTYDQDNACQLWFDIDETCGYSNTEKDEGCGGQDKSTEAWWLADSDENCGKTVGGQTDADDRCNLKYGPWGGGTYGDQAQPRSSPCGEGHC